MEEAATHDEEVILYALLIAFRKLLQVYLL
jgi:hypothetical protein